MNRKLWDKVLILISLAIFLVACTTQKAEIKLKLKNGDMFEIEENTEKSYMKTIEEINNVSTLKKNIAYSCYVKSIDDRNNANVMVTIKEITVSIIMKNGDTIEYSSNLNPRENQEIEKIFSYFVDKNFEVFIGEDGKVNEVVGLDEIIGKGIENIEFFSLESKEEYSKLLFKEFGKESIMMKLNSINNVYRDEAAKVGEKWTKEGEQKEIVTFDTKSEYTLESVSEENIKIIEKTELKTNTEKSKLTIGDNLYDFDVSGEENGEIFMEKETGIIKNLEMTYKVEGMVKITSDSADKGAKEHPIEFTVKNSIAVKK